MDDRPLVTIVVPIFNAEKYLEYCLKSIINQIYDELEIILIDDGSTDRSSEICERYSKIDGRIRVFHIENSGVANARNLGISKAKGAFLAFVDSDDIVDKGYIQNMVKYCIEYNADICTVQHTRISIYDNTPTTCCDKFKKTKDIEILTGKQASYLLYEKEYCGGMIVPWGKLFRRRLLDNMEFSDYRIYEDEAFIYKLIYKARKLIRLEEVLYFYRDTPESIMTQKFSENNLVIFQILKDRFCFYNENDEIALCDLTLNRLYFTYSEYYNKAKKNIDNPKTILQKIKTEQMLLYKKLIRNNRFSIKRKIKYTIALLMPTVFYKIFYS